MQTDMTAARAYIGGINSWEIQSIQPCDGIRSGWKVTLGSTPRIVGDMLPNYDEGAEDGTVFQIEGRDGTAEYDETVLLRRSPESIEGVPGIVMWGMLTCAYESRNPGTFEGTVAFYEDEAEGAALMAVADTEVSRLVVGRALDEIDKGILTLDGNGAHVVDHAERMLGQVSRLNAILTAGITARKAAS